MPVSAVREAWAGRRGAGRRPLSGGRRGSALPVVVAAVVVGLGRPAVALPLAVGGGGAGRLAVRGDLVGPAGRRGQRLERRRVLPLATGRALPGLRGLPGLAESVLGGGGGGVRRVAGGGGGGLAVGVDLVGPAGRRGQRLERRRVLPLAVGAALPGLPGLAEAVLGRAGRVRPLCGALAVALGL